MPGTRSERRLQGRRFAESYVRSSRLNEQHGAAERRERLLKGLGGRVIEVGAGNGLNFGHYPSTVTEVIAVEPNDLLREHAHDAAHHAATGVRVVAGDADALPAPDGSHDAAVLSLVLCTVPDPARTLAEVRRVLRPGGELRFYEHVRSERFWMSLCQVLVTPVWKRVVGGCHPNRTTESAIKRAGFDIVDVDHFDLGGRYNPIVPHVLGRALRTS